MLASVGPRYKYTFNEGGVDELYDLERDPLELKNLLVTPPTPAEAPRLRAWLLDKHEALRPLLHRLAGLKLKKTFGGRLRFFGIGGAAVAADVEKFLLEARFPYAIGYGLTETAPLIAGCGPFRTHYRSCGPALAGVELRIADPRPDTGEGEIQARGANVFTGYFRNEAATRDAFTPDGWFRTGDLGELDSAGFLRIKGRAKELIVTGAGINVYPDELEEILNRLAGVREACVVGIDRGAGDEVHAVLLLDSSNRPAEAIIEEANSRLDELLPLQQNQAPTV